MGKRSSFERVEKDFYRTIDPRAVEILQPFLLDIDGQPVFADDGILIDYLAVQYAEPCIGRGDLYNQLRAYGHECIHGTDIEGSKYGFAEQDALTLTSEEVKDCDVIITNPPWSRDILHPMIEHFSKLKPTWLLFDADWMHTKQSSHYIKDLCTDIVSVGRLKWIEGTTMSGKDNCAWYRFDINKEQETRFHGR